MNLSQLLSGSEAITIPDIPDVRRYRNLMIPMRDGIRLAADLYLPAEADADARLPVVMEYIPYRKDQVDLEARRFYLYLPRHGYIFVRVDIRGTGASQGISLDEYVLQEQEDGYDTVEWLAAQPWCDGHVNMLGISYGGFTALQVATHAPPHLTSIIPVDFTDDRYQDDCHYRGGLLRKYYDIGYYGGFMIAWNAMPPLFESSCDDLAETWKQHLAENEPYLLKWYRHQVNGPYWRHGSVRYVADRIQCPVFMIGGWRDGYMNVPLRLYQALEVPRKVWIGPWNHAMPDAAIPGPRLDYLHEVVRWLDYWSKDRQTGIMQEPPIIIYMQRSEPPVVDRLESRGLWRAETAWPIPDGQDKALYLGDGASLLELPGEDDDATLCYEPTVGTAAGLFSGGIQFGLPGDQRLDEALSQVYTTAPLEEQLHILGRAKAELYISSTATVIGFAVSLSDVAPDGASHLIAKGMLNATRRESFTDPSPLVPGEIYRLEIDIDATGWIFEKGHRIRLAIANADWPNVWPTPQPATSRIYRGAKRPSRLILPVVPRCGSAEPPSFNPSAMVKSRHSHALKPPVWRVCNDVLTGRTTVELAVEYSHRLNEGTTAERSSSGKFQVAPRNPAHASAHGYHRNRLRGLGERSSPAQIFWFRQPRLIFTSSSVWRSGLTMLVIFLSNGWSPCRDIYFKCNGLVILQITTPSP